MKPLIVLGITGSIAAVRSFDLCRELRRRGFDVQVVMSGAASEIVTPQAMEFASGRKVITGITGSVEHVKHLGRKGRAALLLIAPATANTIGKVAMGIDDTAVTTFATTAIGSGKPVLLAPAMHKPMYEHPIVVENLAKLEASGVRVIEPLVAEGKAKLAGINIVAFEAEKALSKGVLKGKKVLVASGAFSVPLDEVRSLTNKSSGKLGNELALACAREKAVVKLVGNGKHDDAISFEEAHSASGLEEKVMRELEEGYDYFLCPAAIPDFDTEKRAGKTGSGKTLVLTLSPRKKMLLKVKERFPALRVVSFKAVWGKGRKGVEAETRKAMRDHGFYAVIGNDLDKNPPGGDRIQVFYCSTKKNRWLEGTKAEVAARIAEKL